ncbi:MAG: dihydrodipicolinate reductase [Dehalococcoidia bacterium]
MKQGRIRTIHYGIGSIGAEVVRLLLKRPDIEIVGAVDWHPAKAGKDLAEVVGLDSPTGITVAYDPEPLLKGTHADLVLHATRPNLTTEYPHLLQIVSTKKSIISCCEELVFPRPRYADLWQKLDHAAREARVRILGTGLNPGFLMDALPLAISTACQEIKSFQINQVVSVGPRPMWLHAKIGTGLNLHGFQQAVQNEVIGYSGLLQSIHMIADTLGWALTDVIETIEPILSNRRITTEYFEVNKGYVAGIRQLARGLMSSREAVRLDLEASLVAENPHTAIFIDGRPPIRLNIPGNIPEEQTTAAIMVNCIPAVVNSQVLGLLSMRDLPFAPYRWPQLQPSEGIIG